jgi:ribulose 1,5-bisphosphate synthetase/thiazole synthase
MANNLESEISTASLSTFHRKLRRRVSCDVIVVGAGPSGLVAGWKLAHQGFRTLILERRLSSGDRIWGRAMGMNQGERRSSMKLIRGLKMGGLKRRVAVPYVISVACDSGTRIRRT